MWEAASDIQASHRVCCALDELMHYAEQHTDRQPAHEHAHDTSTGPKVRRICGGMTSP